MNVILADILVNKPTDQHAKTYQKLQYRTLEL